MIKKSKAIRILFETSAWIEVNLLALVEQEKHILQQ